MRTLYISPLESYQAVRFAGEHVRTFLQGQMTADIAHCTARTFRSCYFCQYQGKVVANGYLLVLSDNYAVFLCHLSLAHTLMEYLNPYAQLSRIDLSLLHFTYYGLSYSNKRHDLPAVLDYKRSDDFVIATLAPGLSIAFGEKRPIDTWLAKQNDVANASASWWSVRMLQASQCMLTMQQHLKFTPNMLGSIPSPSVSVSKGCYTGQEVIARTFHLGKPKRSLYTLSTQSYLYPIDTGVRLQLTETHTYADVIGSCCVDNKLWLQAVMPILSKDEAEFILKPDDFPDNAIAFSATVYRL